MFAAARIVRCHAAPGKLFGELSLEAYSTYGRKRYRRSVDARRASAVISDLNSCCDGCCVQPTEGNQTRRWSWLTVRTSTMQRRDVREGAAAVSRGTLGPEDESQAHREMRWPSYEPRQMPALKSA